MSRCSPAGSVITELCALESREIRAFAEHLALRLYVLDGRRYAEQAGESSDSADGFPYARCFVVAQGASHFRRVINDPTPMPKSSDEWCEALLGAASAAHERRTGATAEFDTSVSYETGSNRAQWG